jgi:hypothetical protein
MISFYTIMLITVDGEASLSNKIEHSNNNEYFNAEITDNLNTSLTHLYATTKM